MTATILPFPTPATAHDPAAMASTAARTGTGTVPPLDALPRTAARQTPTFPHPTAGAAAGAEPFPFRPIAPRIPGPPAQAAHAGSDRRARVAPPTRTPWPATPAADGFAPRAFPAARPIEAGTQPAGQDRLSRALDSLRAALAQQSVAVAAWRASLSELHGATTSLHAGLTLHQSAMRTLGERVAQLGTVSAALPDSLTPGRIASA